MLPNRLFKTAIPLQGVRQLQMCGERIDDVVRIGNRRGWSLAECRGWRWYCCGIVERRRLKPDAFISVCRHLIIGIEEHPSACTNDCLPAGFLPCSPGDAEPRSQVVPRSSPKRRAARSKFESGRLVDRPQ